MRKLPFFKGSWGNDLLNLADKFMLDINWQKLIIVEIFDTFYHVINSILLGSVEN